MSNLLVTGGAGFIGANFVYYWLEKYPNDTVVVLDALDVGWGASGRNGGQVNPMPTFSNPDALRAAAGNQYFERIVSLYLQSADELFGLIAENDIDCQARRCGWMRVDHCEDAKRISRARRASSITLSRSLPSTERRR